MKHEEYIQTFKQKGEFDGCCHILYLDGLVGALDGVFSDILAAYYDPDAGQVDFLVQDSDGFENDWMFLRDFPFSVQKMIVEQIRNY